jgi:hypothetical protein
MSRWGKATWYCPNCGKKHYDDRFIAERINQLVYSCSRECYDAWGLKYARAVLGKDTEEVFQLSGVTVVSDPNQPRNLITGEPRPEETFTITNVTVTKEKGDE